MFESYRGFDVSVEHWEEDKKKKKAKKAKGKAAKEPAVADAAEEGEEESEEEEGEAAQPSRKLKVTEGKLVERDYEKDVTVLNVKGRMVKIKNDLIEQVTLPKAKREKGAK